MFISGVAAPHAASHQPTGTDALYVTGAEVVNDELKSFTDISGSYLKVKETKLNKIPANCTLATSYRARRASGAASSYTRIFRNGSNVGTSNLRNEDTYATFEEDIAGWNSGDLLQLYMVHTSGSGATESKCKDLHATFVSSQGIAPTNQDPE